MKADPMIDCIESVIRSHGLTRRHRKWKIIMMSPSQIVFDQHLATDLSHDHTLIFVSGRYEGIDHRVRLRLQQYYPKHSHKISI